MATRLAQRLIKTARSGDTEAKVSLGKLYLFGGEGLAANEKAALHWLSQAAHEGLAEANVLIAECVARGSAGNEIHHYKNACQQAAEQGHPAGFCALGDIYASPSDQVVDLERAREAYLKAAQSGHLGAATKLGLLLANEGEERLREASNEAARWLKLAADAGDQGAAQGLGKLLWRNGDCEAARWLEPDARRGSPEAMYCLGEILCRQGDRARAEQGVYWLEQAARNDHPLGLWLYGRMHVRQLGGSDSVLPHSPLQAARLLERAAAHGVSKALWDLARIYEMPRFSRRDPGRARQYLEQAAHAGVAEAQLELGRRLARYKNDHSAWITAGRWLSSAGEQGNEDAVALLERIADRAPDCQQRRNACRQRRWSTCGIPSPYLRPVWNWQPVSASARANPCMFIPPAWTTAGASKSI